MKRAITEHEKLIKKKVNSQQKGPNGSKDPKKFDELCNEAYKVFKDQQELEKHLNNRWDTYSADAFGVKKMGDLTDEQKTSFEFYICGWLQYYDQVTRNNAIDHTIYFKWEEQEVIVYISPKPGSKKDPIKSPPANRTSDPQSPKAPPPPNP